MTPCPCCGGKKDQAFYACHRCWHRLPHSIKRELGYAISSGSIPAMQAAARHAKAHWDQPKEKSYPKTPPCATCMNRQSNKKLSDRLGEPICFFCAKDIDHPLDIDTRGKSIKEFL